MIKKTILLFFCAYFLAGYPQDSTARELTNIDEYLYPSSPEIKTISMDFKDAQLNDVLKILSQQSGMNFIASQEISGRTISIYLDKVPVQEAMERILFGNALTYELKPGSNIFVVHPSDEPARRLITRVYRLKYATVNSSSLNQTLSVDQASGSVASGVPRMKVSLLRSKLCSLRMAKSLRTAGRTALS